MCLDLHHILSDLPLGFKKWILNFTFKIESFERKSEILSLIIKVADPFTIANFIFNFLKKKVKPLKYLVHRLQLRKSYSSSWNYF